MHNAISLDDVESTLRSYVPNIGGMSDSQFVSVVMSQLRLIAAKQHNT